MKIFCLIFLSCFWSLAFGNPNCPKLKNGMINVHLVCHTHDDTGWLKTVDEYYYGANKRVTWVGVQYILDSVVDSLLKDKSRKFIFVESAFFFRWWDEQSEEKKNIVKSLVNSGQLEFIGGGWCMNDEAAAHYTAIIDQMTLGLRKLNETFGRVAFPRIAWQIDPFGHSKEQASLFAQMGMDGLFFGRLDHDDKNNRWKNKRMEMVWKGSNSLGSDSWLFTGVLPNGYSPPKGFCFDLLCGDDPIMDDPRLENYNKDTMIEKFLKAVHDQSKGYATSNLIMTMGEDFDYVYAESWYKNLDKLIKYVNEKQTSGSKVNLVYSTPSCYLDALHATGKKWPTKTDDFFPYSSDPHAYWTGYFTSRPTLKGFIRQTNGVLQVAKQLSALAGQKSGKCAEKLVKAVAVAQHHDAVTGTARQHVTNDYNKRLYDGLVQAYDEISENLRILTHTENSLPGQFRYNACPRLNISECSYTEKQKSLTVTLYNPLARKNGHYVRIPVMKSYKYLVKDALNKTLKSQLIPLSETVLKIPGRKSAAKFELVFYADDLPPLGYKQYIVSRTKAFEYEQIKNRAGEFKTTNSIKKGDISIEFDERTNTMTSLIVKSMNKTVKIMVTQNFLWYKGMKGNNTKFEFRASGAYIFRPDGHINIFKNVQISKVFDGPHVTEVHQKWSEWVTQVLRIYQNKKYVEMQWLVGPIPVEDRKGKEIINRISFPNLRSGGVFYTDANGREMQKRVLNSRITWNLTSTEPVSQNYYPVTSAIFIQSKNGDEKAAILNDRAQGGTSLAEGQLELMVHRRLLYDDAFGVGEPLNEMAYGEGLVARGTHLLVHSAFATKTCDFSCQLRTTSEEKFLEPLIMFSSPNAFVKKPKGSNLETELPANIRILTLEPWNDSKWLLRLENFYEKGESSKSGPAKVDIKKMFKNWKITEITELTLAANLLKKEEKRLKWETEDSLNDDTQDQKYQIPKEDEIDAKADFDSNTSFSNSTYSFSPMEIRTFVLSVKEV